MKKQSNRLFNWGNNCSAIGIIAVIVGILAATLDATWGLGLAAAGLGLIVYGPLLRGLAILVRNAEEEIEDRGGEFNK